jgi:GTPase involved in cell partitioning and DNA repair
MGILCHCGVSVNTSAKKHKVKIKGKCKKIKGNLTYLADVCVTNPEKSTLSLELVDKKCPKVNNFLFTANAITSVVCKEERQNSVVTIKGTGIVNGVH